METAKSPVIGCEFLCCQVQFVSHLVGRRRESSAASVTHQHRPHSASQMKNTSRVGRGERSRDSAVKSLSLYSLFHHCALSFSPVCWLQPLFLSIFFFYFFVSLSFSLSVSAFHPGALALLSLANVWRHGANLSVTSQRYYFFCSRQSLFTELLLDCLVELQMLTHDASLMVAVSRSTALLLVLCFPFIITTIVKLF